MHIFTLFLITFALLADDTVLDHVKELADSEPTPILQQNHNEQDDEPSHKDPETAHSEINKDTNPTLSCNNEQTIQPTQNIVTITNAIEPKSLEYNYWGTHTPDSFSILINENELKQGESCEIEKTNKELTVTYSYSFASGMYTGSKAITYEINKNAHEEKLTFSLIS